FSLQPGRRAALTAHEIGHNFNAHHCDAFGTICSPCWIMLTSLGNTTNELTRLGCSTPIITSFALSRPCLGGGLVHSPLCTPDFDHDGVLTANDFVAFMAAAAANDPSADLDGDGRITVADFVAFQRAFAGGCP